MTMPESPSFKIVGGDGREYGPTDLGTLQQWAREGRLREDTQVWDSRAGAWQMAAQVPELAAIFSIAPPLSAAASVQTPAVAQGTNKLAMWSLVCGILGLSCCGVFAIAAIPLGMSALGQIRRQGGEGRGLAVAGIALGITGLVFGVIMLLFFLPVGITRTSP